MVVTNWIVRSSRNWKNESLSCDLLVAFLFPPYIAGSLKLSELVFSLENTYVLCFFPLAKQLFPCYNP